MLISIAWYSIRWKQQHTFCSNAHWALQISQSETHIGDTDWDHEIDQIKRLLNVIYATAWGIVASAWQISYSRWGIAYHVSAAVLPKMVRI
jgi:urease accessory protein UreF